MKLGTYLEEHGITYADFASRIDVSHARTVERYAKGLRLPDAAIMKRIVEVTVGTVMPNDFFELGEFETSMEATASAGRDAGETGKKAKVSTPNRPFPKPALAEVCL